MASSTSFHSLGPTFQVWNSSWDQEIAFWAHTTTTQTSLWWVWIHIIQLTNPQIGVWEFHSFNLPLGVSRVTSSTRNCLGPTWNIGVWDRKWHHNGLLQMLRDEQVVGHPLVPDCDDPWGRSWKSVKVDSWKNHGKAALHVCKSNVFYQKWVFAVVWQPLHSIEFWLMIPVSTALYRWDHVTYNS